MIITCPQCDSRFVVPSTLFASGGRKVKCASCKHVWYQDEPLDSLVEEIADHEQGGGETFADALSQSEDVQSNKKRGVLSGVKVAAASCVTVLFMFFGYQMFKPTLIMGEGLAFNDIAVERTEEGLILSGEIVNTMRDRRGVPSVKVTALMAEDIKGDVMLIAPDKDILEGGEVLEMRAVLHHISEEAQKLDITFEGGAAQTEIKAEPATDD